MMPLRERIAEKLADLPESQLREVLTYVEFLTWRAPEGEDPLLSVTGILRGGPLSAEQIQEALYGNGINEP